ncbi:MAG: hypothetical protein V3U87_10780 [Methylococcaceae bacterium]
MWAGEDDSATTDKIILTKAGFTSAVLGQTIIRSENTLKIIATKIQNANRIRLIGQIAAVVGSSTAIGAISFDKEVVAQLSAGLALLGSISGILADYSETILSKKSGNINDIFFRLSGYIQEAAIIKNNIDAYIDNKISEKELVTLVTAGNELCRKINMDALQITQYWLKYNKNT